MVSARQRGRTEDGLNEEDNLFVEANKLVVPNQLERGNFINSSARVQMAGKKFRSLEGELIED